MNHNSVNGKQKKVYDAAEKKRRRVSLIVMIAFVAALALIGILAGEPMMRLVKDPVQFRVWVEKSGWVSRVAFIGMVILQLIVAVIPGEPIELAAGYAFGAVEGTILCLVGMTLGSLIVFLLVRKFGVKLIETFFPIEKINEFKFLKDNKRLNLLIFILFFIPGTPKDILTYVVGLTNVNMFSYLLISNLARIPSVVSSTIAGGAVGDAKYAVALWVFGATAVVSIIGVWIYRRIAKKHSDK